MARATSLFKPATDAEVAIRKEIRATDGYKQIRTWHFDSLPNFTLHATIDLERAHGLNLEEEVVRHLGGEARRNIDQQAMQAFTMDEYLEAGFVYVPHIPVYSTPVLIQQDLVAQRGFLSGEVNVQGTI